MPAIAGHHCHLVAAANAVSRAKCNPVFKGTLEHGWDETFEVPVSCGDGALFAGVNRIAEVFSSEAFIDTLLHPMVVLQGQTGVNILEETEKNNMQNISYPNLPTALLH